MRRDTEDISLSQRLAMSFHETSVRVAGGDQDRPSGGADADPDVLVSADWVAQHLDDPSVRIIESNEDQLLYSAGHIAGAVQVGDYCFFAINSTVADQLTVADRCFIGASALVTKSTQPGEV